jgi:hypothetical protein
MQHPCQINRLRVVHGELFTWAGFDEGTEVSGTGSVELQDDGSLEIEFAYHLGDEAVLKAVRTGSSIAC